MFDRLAGVFDTEARPDNGCEVNPMHQLFSTDRTQGLFHRNNPHESHNSEMILTNTGTITAFDTTSVIFLSQRETRRGADGALLQ